MDKGTVGSMLREIDVLAAWFSGHSTAVSDRFYPSVIKPALIRQYGSILNSHHMNAVFWKLDLWMASQQGFETFEGRPVPFHLFPMHSFWYLETDLNMSIKTGLGRPEWDDGKWGISNYFIHNLTKQQAGGRAALQVIAMLARMPEDIHTDDQRYPLFVPIEQIYEGEPCSWSLAPIVAAAEFMSLPFVCKETIPHSRPDRRRAERSGKTLPCTSIVSLRRREYTNSGIQTDSDREYSCQWIRRGHWRKLHQPRKADGAEITYVTEALCGPEGKPLKTPSMRVAAVTR